jgi:hypothetical protein
MVKKKHVLFVLVLLLTFLTVMFLHGPDLHELTRISVNATSYEPPDGKVYIGLEQSDMSVSGLTQFGDSIGKTPFLFGFFQWFNHEGDRYPDYMLSLAKKACDAGVCGGVWMSWQPLDTENGASVGSEAENDEITIKQVASGERDVYIREVADKFRDFPYPKLIGFGCEMNGFWEGYGYSSTVYKNAFRHVVEIFRQENAQVAFVFQPNHAPDDNTNCAYAGRELIQNYYPGDDIVDWISVSAHASTWVQFGTVKQAMDKGNYLNLFTTTKPFIFSEMGGAPRVDNTESPTLSDRITWLNSFFDYCQSNPRVKGFMYYNYDATTLQSEPPLAEVFKNGVANEAFVNGNTLISALSQPTS